MSPPLRKLGLTSAICLVVANMIGSGVFTTSGFALANLGTPARVIAAWCVGGVVAISGAYSYGLLARELTASGGEYFFLSRLVHPAAGFLAGWVSLFAGFSGPIAASAIAFEAYLWPQSPPLHLPTGLLPCGLIIAAGMMHIVGLRFGAIGQNAVVMLKLLFVGGFVAFATTRLVRLDLAECDAGPFSMTTFAMSLVWISFSFSGFNAAVYLAEEVDDAGRNVPRALMLSTVAVTIVYVLFNSVIVLTPPMSAISGRPDVAVACAEVLGGPTLVLLVRATICLALLSGVSSMVMIGPRVYAKMAEDGLFPRWLFAGEQVPKLSILLQVTLACGFALMTGLVDLINYLGFTLSLTAAGTAASIFLRRGRALHFRPWQLGMVAFYVLATLVLAGLAAWDDPRRLLGTIVTVVSGLGVYAWVAHQKKKFESTK